VILHSIELHNVGPFLGDKRLGPLDRGLNVLAAPNESGKTTALRAAARALFDRHTTKDGEIKSLQPAGTDLGPRVAVEFETRTGRFRIEKNFLQTPTSVLQQWQGAAWTPLAEGDAADRRVQELLNSSLPGRGSTKPEHWGFLGFLWARQGEPSNWPVLDGDAVGAQIRARLVRVELDPVIEQLRVHLASAAEEILTSTGRPRTNGPLERAEEELARVDADLHGLRQTRLELESAHQRYEQAAAAAVQLEREQAEREKTARDLATQAAAAERLRGEIEARQSDLAATQTKLEQIVKDVAALKTRRDELTAAQKDLTAAEETAAQAEKELVSVRSEIDTRQTSRPGQERLLSDLRAAHQGVRDLIRLREFTAQATALAKQLAAAEESARVVTEHQGRLARLPALTAKQLQKLQASSDTIQTLRAHVQALGLAIELSPDRDADVVVESAGESRKESLPAGQPHRIHSPDDLTLTLTGWGRIVIRSGAGEVRDAAKELDQAEEKFRSALATSEVSSLEAAREGLAARAALESEMKAATAAHAHHLGDQTTLVDLRTAVASAQRRVETLTAPTAEASASTPKESRPLAELEAEDARLADAIPAAERVLQSMDADLVKLRTCERSGSETVQKCSSSAGQHRASVRAAESQIVSLMERYSEGIDAAQTQAAIEAVKAEARRDETRKQLPPDFEALPDRNRRAAAALQQITNELATRRAERDAARGALETLGGQGIYSRETALEEQRVEILLRRDAARTSGWAARIAHDLIEFRKQAATRAVLSPLEDRLTAAFARLTGIAERRVFLDDSLQVAGLGRNREAVHAFENLSQGAREQLLLCLRIAVAQELATDEPQTLILDDVLVNTDSVRQERVLDLLGALSTDLQILILTCHPDRYRGVGHSVSL